jgi:hypothetical protein
MDTNKKAPANGDGLFWFYSCVFVCIRGLECSSSSFAAWWREFLELVTVAGVDAPGGVVVGAETVFVVEAELVVGVELPD